MSFARQKRLLLGWLALIAPIPLPFNGVIGWPLVILYLIGVVLFLRRASLDAATWLPTWGMNVLGLAYIPLFFLDLFVISHGLVAPVLHLCLFALVVKLFAIVRERDKWQASIGIFFLFLAAMGTSVHPTIVLYLIGFLVLSLVLLTRFAFLHVLSGFGREDPALARIPLRGFLLLATVATAVIAVPLFLLLPRVRAPFIVGRGGGTGVTLEAAGFSDQVTLDSIGRIRNSREVVMRMLEESPGGADREMRFKTATYDVYQGGSWRRSPSLGNLGRGQGVRFRLGTEKPVRWAHIWLQPLHSSSMPLPVETAVVEPRSSALLIDAGGALSFPVNPLEVSEYRVGLARSPVLVGAAPVGSGDSALDLTGLTPKITALAAQAMGQGTEVRRAHRLEAYLIENYTYTLDFAGRSPRNPIEDFLFRYRSGQCEYFASSMVLMLRSQGVPARLVTGFLGGEFNPFEGYYIVRDNNAHAWVEAYVGGAWRIFDPTPPAGRPAAGREGASVLAQQAWDFLIFRWDRYVLTFGLYDQLRIFGSLRELWVDLWAHFRHEDQPGKTAHPSAGLDALRPSALTGGRRGLPNVPLPLAIGLTLLAVVAWVLYLRLRPPLTATTAYRRLRRRLGRGGPSLADSLPPLGVRRETEARYPAAAAPVARVIDFYLRESFGGQPLEDEELEVLKVALDEAEKNMRKAG